MMTFKELSELLGVSTQTVRRAFAKLYPMQVENGVETQMTLTQSKAVVASLKVKATDRIKLTGNEPLQNVKVVLPQNEEVDAGSITQLLRAAADAIESRDRQISIMAPKAEIFDHIADSTNLKSVAEVAQIIGTGRNKLFKLMRATGIVNEFNRPYQQYIDSGYLQVKDTVKTINGKPQTFPQAFFTGKGELWISRKLSATHQIGTPE